MLLAAAHDWETFNTHEDTMIILNRAALVGEDGVGHMVQGCHTFAGVEEEAVLRLIRIPILCGSSSSEQ